MRWDLEKEWRRLGRKGGTGHAFFRSFFGVFSLPPTFRLTGGSRVHPHLSPNQPLQLNPQPLPIGPTVRRSKTDAGPLWPVLIPPPPPRFTVPGLPRCIGIVCYFCPDASRYPTLCSKICVPRLNNVILRCPPLCLKMSNKVFKDVQHCVIGCPTLCSKISNKFQCLIIKC